MIQVAIIGAGFIGPAHLEALRRLGDVEVVALCDSRLEAAQRKARALNIAHANDRVEALRLAEAFRAKVIDANVEHFIFEITGKGSKIDQFIAIMKPLGLVEICRTGVAAMNRGPQGM